MLFSLINGYNLPHLERTAVDRLTLLLLNATQRYYDENAVRGCMDSEAENFNFQVSPEGVGRGVGEVVRRPQKT